MSSLIDRTLETWIRHKSRQEALIAVFNHVRDIPYGVWPELNPPQHYECILERGAGSCTPKHLLLAEMARRLGWEVLLVVYPYRWDEFAALYPPRLQRLARTMPAVNHLACRVLIKGRYVLVDATIDPPLGRIGLPVNEDWDGESDTGLPVLPLAEEEIYHPLEARLMPPPRLSESERAFYQGLNAYLERVRKGEP